MAEQSDNQTFFQYMNFLAASRDCLDCGTDEAYTVNSLFILRI